jgi:hypothetical protein
MLNAVVRDDFHLSEGMNVRWGKKRRLQHRKKLKHLFAPLRQIYCWANSADTGLHWAVYPDIARFDLVARMGGELNGVSVAKIVIIDLVRSVICAPLHHEDSLSPILILKSQSFRAKFASTSPSQSYVWSKKSA